jgi:hypothetical protein
MRNMRNMRNTRNEMRNEDEESPRPQFSCDEGGCGQPAVLNSLLALLLRMQLCLLKGLDKLLNFLEQPHI